jgi:ATP-binding cassette subfamily F protein uup
LRGFWRIRISSREPDKFAKATAALAQRQDKLTAAEEEWLELETLREELT